MDEIFEKSSAEMKFHLGRTDDKLMDKLNALLINQNQGSKRSRVFGLVCGQCFDYLWSKAKAALRSGRLCN